MKNYFFVADAAMKSKLQEAGIGFCDLELDDVAGIVVEGGEIGRALDVIGVRVIGESPSTLDGIFFLTLNSAAPSPPAPKKFSVTVASWDGGNHQNGFKKAIEEILLPAVGMDVIMSVPHKKTVAPVTDSKFYIRIWSSPSGQASVHPPQRIWEMQVGCQDNSFLPSGEGIQIADQETGWVVGELVGNNNLYIHYDVCHDGTSSEIQIFRRILEEVAVELSATPEEKEARRAKMAEVRKNKSREEYVRECSKRFEKTLEGTKAAITNGKKEIERLQQALVRKIRETAGAERKLEQLSSCKGGELEKYGREFDKLLAVPKVRNAQVSDGVIKVFTDTLFCTDPRSGKLHEIGAFRIEIYTSNGDVRWYNLTRQIRAYKEGMHAPHVFPDGKACLGTMAEIIPELVGNYEYSALAMVAIQFVESVNTDDAAGKHIDKWPVVQAAGKEG